MAGRDGIVNWIERFKIAVIEEDDRKITQLLDEMPRLNDEDQIKKAMKLIQHAIDVYTQKRDVTALQMQKILDEKKFFSSVDSKTTAHRLDITS